MKFKNKSKFELYFLLVNLVFELKGPLKNLKMDLIRFTFILYVQDTVALLESAATPRTPDTDAHNRRQSKRHRRSRNGYFNLAFFFL